MSKEMIYIYAAGILVDASLCFWCLGASNFHVDLVFAIVVFVVAPIGAGAPRRSRTLGARTHVERNDIHFSAGILVDASLCFWWLLLEMLNVLILTKDKKIISNKHPSFKLVTRI